MEIEEEKDREQSVYTKSKLSVEEEIKEEVESEQREPTLESEASEVSDGKCTSHQ